VGRRDTQAVSQYIVPFVTAVKFHITALNVEPMMSLRINRGTTPTDLTHPASFPLFYVTGYAARFSFAATKSEVRMQEPESRRYPINRFKQSEAGGEAYPQLPQFLERHPAQLFPDEADPLDEPELFTLKADMRRVTSVFLHFGHCTRASRLSTSSSNFLRHLLQRNSYMGIAFKAPYGISTGLPHSGTRN
jgi:hypothetical protein